MTRDHGCPKQPHLPLVRFALRSEAEEGALRRVARGAPRGGARPPLLCAPLACARGAALPCPCGGSPLRGETSPFPRTPSTADWSESLPPSRFHPVPPPPLGLVKGFVESRGGALPEEGLRRPSSARPPLRAGRCSFLPSRGMPSAAGEPPRSPAPPRPPTRLDRYRLAASTRFRPRRLAS
jgi:hypothetical protein